MDDLPSALSVDPAGRRIAGLLRDRARLTASELLSIESDAVRHGALPLLASSSDGAHARALLRDAIALDAARTAVAIDALDALHRADVRVLVLKGSHLAVSHYSAPHLRPCSDVDLLIPGPMRNAARQALERIDFTLVPHVRGDLILTQMHFARDTNRFPHALDVHWNVLNPHVFHGLLSFDDAWARSVPIPALGRFARGLSSADAMLLATTHPAAHHSGDVRLIWIVDIDRLAAVMTVVEWADFVRRARCARVTRVARASLATACDLLRTTIPDSVLDALATDDSTPESSAEYLRPASRAERLWSDLQALNGWRTRAQYMRQHLFPDSGYMRVAYGDNALLLPWRYFTRITFGAIRWLRN